VPSTKDKEYGLFRTPTTQDARIGPNNIGGNKHRVKRGSTALSDQILFPTPTNMDHIVRKGMRPSRAATGRKTGYLSEMVAQQLPTPTAKMYTNSKAIFDPAATSLSKRTLEVYARTYPQPKMWHTPTAREHKNSGNITKWDPEYLKTHPSLTHQAIKSEKKIGGALNPEWVEWLMGYPIGWTE